MLGVGPYAFAVLMLLEEDEWGTGVLDGWERDRYVETVWVSWATLCNRRGKEEVDSELGGWRRDEQRRGQKGTHCSRRATFSSRSVLLATSRSVT